MGRAPMRALRTQQASNLRTRYALPRVEVTMSKPGRGRAGGIARMTLVVAIAWALGAEACGESAVGTSVPSQPEASSTTVTSSTVVSTTPAAAARPRVVVLSGAGAEMSDDEVAIPLVRAFASSIAGVVAGEAGNDDPGGREVFVGPLRRDGQLAPGVSTIDNLDAFAGRAALVVLLRQPAPAPAGHFGVGPQAQREVPPPVPEP